MAEVIAGAVAEGLPVAVPIEGAEQVHKGNCSTNGVAFPEPFTEQVVNLNQDPAGAKIRLQRSNRYRQMRIATDEKPDPKYLQMFRDAGMRWRGQEKAWSIQLDRDAAWRTALDIERLFYDVANGIREDNGLSAVRVQSR